MTILSQDDDAAVVVVLIELCQPLH